MRSSESVLSLTKQCLKHKRLVFILYSCCVFVGFLFVAFAVWTTFGREPPLNCRLAVLSTVLMGSFELGDFWLGNVVCPNRIFWLSCLYGC